LNKHSNAVKRQSC